MFRKKEPHSKSVTTIPARYVKKDGVIADTGNSSPNYSPVLSRSTGRPSSRYENVVPPNDISESYLPNKQPNRSLNTAPNPSKGARRKFAPSFLIRKKKNQAGNRYNYENTDIEEEDVTDIAFYDDLVSEQESINPVILGQLDDSQLSTIEAEPFQKLYKSRVDFVLNNYRKPPPYPGTKEAKKMNVHSTSQLQTNVDTPLIRQLLKDKSLNDNASMNNYSPRGSNQAPSSETQNYINDKLVSRTQDIVTAQSRNSEYSNMLNAGELYEKRRQYYMQSMTNLKNTPDKTGKKEPNHDSLSAVYPAKDYEKGNQKKGIPQSVSVPNLNQSSYQNITEVPQRHARGQIEAAEIEALIAHYRKNSLDNFQPYEIHSSASESVSLYSQGSPAYVPPSPYLNAEIPEWLQVYAKASPELDQYLKWNMFRHPELDCWQTMLKRLYKKELEQVVLWFEEYRLALQQEMENRKLRMAISSSPCFKKTDV